MSDTMTTDQTRALIEDAIAPLREEVAELRSVIDRFEDAADVRAFDAADRDGETFPLHVVKRLLAGEHPVRTYREHRRMTQAELATAAGTTAPYISQIENGVRRSGRKLEARLAEALAVDVDDLRPQSGSDPLEAGDTDAA